MLPTYRDDQEQGQVGEPDSPDISKGTVRHYRNYNTI